MRMVRQFFFEAVSMLAVLAGCATTSNDVGASQLPAPQPQAPVLSHSIKVTSDDSGISIATEANGKIYATLPRAPDAPVAVAIADESGTAKIAWAAFPAGLVEGASWTPIATIVVGLDRSVDTSPPVTVDLTRARDAATESAWQDATAKNTALALEAFDTRFPDSIHDQESQRLQLALKVATVGDQAEVALGAGDSAAALADADECLAQDKTDSQCIDIRAKAVVAVVAAATRDAALQLKKADFETALATVGTCLRAQPDFPACTALEAKIRKAYVKALLASARKDASAGSFGDALSTLDTCDTVAPGSPDCTAARTKINAAADRAEAKAAADEARAEAREAAAEARAAAAEARAEARAAAKAAYAVKHPPKVTLAEFNQLYNGMSYRQAVDILGSPGKVQSEMNVGGYDTISYEWSGGDYSSATAIFQNGSMYSKMQFGLK